MKKLIKIVHAERMVQKSSVRFPFFSFLVALLIILILFLNFDSQVYHRSLKLLPSTNLLLSDENERNLPDKCKYLPYIERLRYLAENSGSRLLLHYDTTPLMNKFAEFFENLHILYDIRTLLGTKKVNYLELYTTDAENQLNIGYLSMHHLATNLIMHQTRRSSVHPDIEKNKRNFDTTFSSISDERIDHLSRMNNLKIDFLYIGSEVKDSNIADEIYSFQNIAPSGLVVITETNINFRNRWDFLVRTGDLYIAHGCIKSLCLYLKAEKKNTVSSLYPTNRHVEYFGIIMSTYQRKNGKSPAYLSRSLKSIQEQSFTCIHLYLIGDAYTNETEFFEIIAQSGLDSSRITAVNLKEPGERNKGLPQKVIWQIGGSAAVNQALELATGKGHEWILHMDDDEWWLPSKCEEMYKLLQSSPGAAFAFHACQENSGTTLPVAWQAIKGAYPSNSLPEIGNIVHSTYFHHINAIQDFRFPGYQSGKAVEAYEPGDITLIKYTQKWLADNPDRYSIFIPKILGRREGEKESLSSTL